MAPALAALGVVGVVGGLGLYFVSNRPPPTGEGVRPAAIALEVRPAVPPAEPPSQVEPAATDFEPLSPRADVPQPLKPRAGLSPETICSALASAGFPNDGWQPSPFDAQLWECVQSVSEPVSPDVAAAPQPAGALFYVLRGRQEGQLDDFRIKVTQPGPSGAEIWDRAQALVSAFAKAAGEPVPQDFVSPAAANEQRALQTLEAGYQWSRELSELPRFNLFVRFNQPQTSRLTMSTQAAEWTEWVEPFGGGLAAPQPAPLVVDPAP